MANPDPDFVSFLRAYPAYPATHMIDDLRASEYARLDLGGHIYLDYTGGGLYAESQLRRHNRLLSEHVFGNPHSSNPTSQAATQLVEHAREYVLKFLQRRPRGVSGRLHAQRQRRVEAGRQVVSIPQWALSSDV